jgi:hypothetical protein
MSVMSLDVFSVRYLTSPAISSTGNSASVIVRYWDVRVYSLSARTDGDECWPYVMPHGAISTVTNVGPYVMPHGTISTGDECWPIRHASRCHING